MQPAPAATERRPGRNFEKNYLNTTDETIRAKAAKLVATAMMFGPDPDDYFTKAIVKGAEMEMGEGMTGQRFKDIIVQGGSPEYETIVVWIWVISKVGPRYIIKLMLSYSGKILG